MKKLFAVLLSALLLTFGMAIFANATEYGLQAGVFTNDYSKAMRCAREVEAGTVFVNKQSTFRTDNMPFGGFKNSGVGKEGIKYAVDEMTKTKLIGLNLR